MRISERSLEKAAPFNGAPHSSESLGRAVANVLRAAEESAEALRQEAAAEANETLERAIERAERIGYEAANKAVSLLDEAAGKAERLTYEAERHARELTEAAQRQCEGMLQTLLQRQQWFMEQQNELSTRLHQAQDTVAKLKSMLVSDQAGERLGLSPSDERDVERVFSRDEATPAAATDTPNGEGSAQGSPLIATE